MWPWDIKGPRCTRFHLFMYLPRAHSGCLCIVQCPKTQSRALNGNVVIKWNILCSSFMFSSVWYSPQQGASHMHVHMSLCFQPWPAMTFSIFVTATKRTKNNCNFCSCWAERQKAADNLSSVQKCSESLTSVCLHAKNTLYTSCNFRVMNRTLTRCR